IEDQVAEGDMVVTRWSGRATHTGEFRQIAPTGKQVAVDGITINRVAGGKFVETWLQFDRLGLLQQLGGGPSAGAGSSSERVGGAARRTGWWPPRSQSNLQHPNKRATPDSGARVRLRVHHRCARVSCRSAHE